MGSGVLLAALVVLWFVVLVPMVVTRGDSSAERSTGADAGRTLQRRRTVDPAVFAETERVSIDRTALRTSGELRVDVHAVRRRTLAVLLALTLLALVGALVWTPWLWIAQGVLDVAVVAYLVVLRAVARRERLAARGPPRGPPAAPEPAAGAGAPAAPGPGRGRPHRRPGRLAEQRRRGPGRRRHRFRRHRRLPAAPGRQRVKDPLPPHPSQARGGPLQGGRSSTARVADPG